MKLETQKLAKFSLQKTRINRFRSNPNTLKKRQPVLDLKEALIPRVQNHASTNHTQTHAHTSARKTMGTRLETTKCK